MIVLLDIVHHQISLLYRVTGNTKKKIYSKKVNSAFVGINFKLKVVIFLCGRVL